MLFAFEYRLHDLLGVSGATVIFALIGAILLGGFAAKYVQLFDRYRALAGEFRMIPELNARKASILKQIDNYRRRIRLLNVACLCMGSALMLFLFTVVVASLSVIDPELPWLRPLGTIGLIGGILLACGAVGLDLAEVHLSRSVICDEVTDVDGCCTGKNDHESLNGTTTAALPPARAKGQ